MFVCSGNNSVKEEEPDDAGEPEISRSSLWVTLREPRGDCGHPPSMRPTMSESVGENGSNWMWWWEPAEALF